MPPKLRQWEIVRIVKEKYYVEDFSKRGALRNAENPYEISIINETCEVIKDSDESDDHDV